MAKNDEWCELCGEKLKSTKIKMVNRVYEVCGHCASLTVGVSEDEENF